MSIAKERAREGKVLTEERSIPPNDERTYFDRESLELTIDLVLNADEHAPHFLGQLFTSFRQAIDSGLNGINETRTALAQAVDVIYLYSPEHAAAIELYRRHLEGELRPEDEPLQVLKSAIGRTTTRLHAEKSAGRIKKRTTASR